MSSKPGLTKTEEVFFVKNFEGQDTTTTDLSLSNKGDKAQNARFGTEVGAVVKREALAYYNTTAEASPIQSMYRYYKKSDSTQYLLQINGTTLRVGADATGTFSTLATLSSSSGRKFSAVTYNDLALISTGYDNIIQTDGVAAWELGSCKAAEGAAGSVDIGSHRYSIVFNTAADGSGTDYVNDAVSNTVTIADSTKKIELTNVPIGPTSGTFVCLSRVVYRTKIAAPTGVRYKVAVIGNNTATTYQDDTAEAGLSDAMGAVTDDMPKGQFLYVAQERLFVTGDPSYPNTVYYSDQFLPHAIWTSTAAIGTTAATDYYDFIGRNDNDQITGIKGHLGITYIFKQNSIRPYYVEGTPDTWRLGDAVSTQGCPAPYSIINTPYGVVYQGWDHWYLFNGNFSQPIIDEFPVTEMILRSRLGSTYAEYHKNLVYASYTDAELGHQYNDKVMVYNMIRKQLSIDKGGPKEVTIQTTAGAVNIGCFAAARGGTDEGQLYAGDSVLGLVYKYDRAPNAVQYSTKTDLDTGTHTDTSVAGTENQPILTRETLEDMETYTTDALAQAAWVTSTVTASTYVPHDLGTGVDGDKTVSVSEDLTAGIYNYTALTINTGITLTVTGTAVIKCLGTVTITGTLAGGIHALTIYAQAITVSSGGILSGEDITLRCNTLTNSGTM